MTYSATPSLSCPRSWLSMVAHQERPDRADGPGTAAVPAPPARDGSAAQAAKSSSTVEMSAAG